MGAYISNLFTSLSQKASKTPTATAYVDKQALEALINLVKKHGNLKIAKTPAGFEVRIGTHYFGIDDYMNLIRLTLNEVHELSVDEANLTAELASILLPESDKPILLQASTFEDERRLWVAVRQIFKKRPLKAFNEDQRQRFSFLEQHYAEKNAFSTSSTQSQHDSNRLQKGYAPINPSNLLSGFLKPSEGKGCASIYTENDAFSFLMQLAIEYGELSLNQNDSGFSLLLQGFIFDIEFFRDYGTLRLLSPMGLGAAELMLRIYRFINGDASLQKELRLEAEREADEIALWEVALQFNENVQIQPMNEGQRTRLRSVLERRSQLALVRQRNFFMHNATQHSQRSEPKNPSGPTLDHS